MADQGGEVDYQKLRAFNFVGNGTEEPTSWKIGERIGHGSHGMVYKATVENATIAVKKLPNDLNLDEEKEEILRKERDTLMTLSHERIITYLGFCVANQMLHIFLEFAKGGSLHAFIDNKTKRNEKIDEAHASRITLQIVQGVAYLHENNLFHRDIKSANVLMSDVENVKLADFGLTRTFEEVSNTYTKGIGTGRFMAPESVDYEKHYGNPVDIWGTGCIVVHMLSGKVPYSGIKDHQIARKLDRDPTPAKEILPTVSYGCQLFLKKTLAINPANRPTAQMLLLDHFVTGREPPDIEIDAESERSEPENVQEVLNERQKGSAESKQQAGATNFNFSPSYTTHTTFNRDHIFQKDFHVDKVENVKVERLENLKANQVKTLEAHGASAVGVTEANKVKATSENLEVKQAGTVNVERLENLKANKVETLEAHGASAVGVTEANKVKATAENLEIKQAGTVNVAQNSTLNLAQADVFNIENVQYLHIV